MSNGDTCEKINCIESTTLEIIDRKNINISYEDIDIYDNIVGKMVVFAVVINDCYGGFRQSAVYFITFCHFSICTYLLIFTRGVQLHPL